MISEFLFGSLNLWFVDFSENTYAFKIHFALIKFKEILEKIAKEMPKELVWVSKASCPQYDLQ